MREKIPYSDNLIFIDTEFTDLDVKTGELLSIALIKYTGEELYLELASDGPMHPWVVKHVLPTLNKRKTSQEAARNKIRKFVGDSKPYLVAYVNQFDAIYWYKLFGSAKEHPAYWIPIDFASLLFAQGFSPNSMGKHRFFKELGIDKDKYVVHNALDDARLLRETYFKFFKLDLPIKPNKRKVANATQK